MRKITREASKALRNGENYSNSNTIVKGCTLEPRSMKLHDNTIAVWDGEAHTLTINDCGWQSTTTKERLNGVLYYFGLGHIFQKNYTWYYMNTDRKVFNFDSSMSFDI